LYFYKTQRKITINSYDTTIAERPGKLATKLCYSIAKLSSYSNNIIKPKSEKRRYL